MLGDSFYIFAKILNTMAKLACHFYLKDKNTINLTPINLHFGVGKFRKKIAIGVHLWDSDKERAIISSSESRNNQALAKRVNRAISANKRTGRVPQQDTIWNYRNTIRRYSDYIHDSGLKDSFRLFNEDFAIPFDDYLRNEQELSNNSICATHSQLKTMLRRAYEKGLLKDSSFLL